MGEPYGNYRVEWWGLNKEKNVKIYKNERRLRERMSKRGVELKRMSGYDLILPPPPPLLIHYSEKKRLHKEQEGQ